MRHRVLATLLLVLVLLVWIVPSPVAGQVITPRGTWSGAQTPWGHPDLQGIWTNTTTTPLERPDDLAGKEVLTEEEWALRNPESGLSDDRPGPDVGFYNDFWLDQGVLSRRTSLIVDPPDGQFPAVTATEQKGQRTRTDSYIGDRFDSWEDFNTYDRCITRGLPGAMVPGFYNHNYQILQTPDYVVIVVEMIHDARIIPLDGRPHISPGIRQWLGDSRGHWDGDTLVVETTNSTDKVQARDYPPRDIHTVFGGDDQLRLVERFTRIDADTIDYQFTVTDPTIWTGPWTAAIPMTTLGGQIFEYACHEGNYSLQNILSGARVDERAAGTAAR